MSVNALSQSSHIWSRATTALTNTPDTTDINSGKTTTPAPNTAPKPANTPAHGPFEKLSNDLQAVLMQWQQTGLAQTSTSEQATPPGTAAYAPQANPDSGQADTSSRRGVPTA